MPISHQFSHIANCWAALMADALYSQGVRHVCIAPGSRSTPLTVAFVAYQDFEIHTHFDERSLGFLALGIAKSSESPVVIVTTSGSAVANLLPAVVEAHYSHAPLVILSADRPPELIDCGANQAIRQHGIFGNYVLHSVTMPVPSTDIPAQNIFDLVTDVAMRCRHELRPIHLNCPFREPFTPTSKQSDFSDYLASLDMSLPNDTKQHHVCVLPDKVKDACHRNGVIVCGRLRSKDDQAHVFSIAKHLSWPIIADVQFGLFSKQNLILLYADLILSAHPTLLNDADVVLTVGDHLTSKALMSALDEFEGIKLTHRYDDYDVAPEYRNATFVTSSLGAFSDAIQELDVNHSIDGSFTQRWLDESNRVHSHIDAVLDTAPFSEWHVARRLPERVPDAWEVFVSNSLPIRLLDSVAGASCNDISVAANRGASGIDGILSTAIGRAEGARAPVVLLIGDLAFLYDLNAILILAKSTFPVVVIVLNNNGGGIFKRLKIAENKSLFSPYFEMPQHVRLKGVCEFAGVSYHNVTTLSEFDSGLDSAISKKSSTIIEVSVDSDVTTDVYQRLLHLGHDVR